MVSPTDSPHTPRPWTQLRFCRRFGKRNENKATFALAHTLIVIIWHVLSEGTDYDDMGGDYFERRNDAEARKRYLVRELEKLGNTVTLEPAA